MILLGDLHGNWNYLQFLIKGGMDKHIVQVGDFGLGFKSFGLDSKDLQLISDMLDKFDKYLYIIRGNHDNPEFWTGELVDRWKRIMLIPDYSIVEIEEKNVLCIGGATSIDRKGRRAGYDYWEDEGILEDWDRLDECLKMKIDVVVTHNAPRFAFPTGLNALVNGWLKVDDKLAEDLNRERQLLDIIWTKIKEKNNPTHWVYGHFHEENQQLVDETNFICLGVGTTWNLK